MPSRRALSLKREALTELSPADLTSIAAGGLTNDTCYSCMTVISCYLTDCIARDTVRCVD